MKLHRLELQGFGPFLDRQVVDFDAFDGDGIFLISGRTGAGKSSILDGVTFALYGGVPRYEGGEKRIRSDHAAPDDPTEVRLEFTADDRRFVVTRSPDHDKPKKRGEGLTPVAHAAQLDELVDGTWIVLAAKPREVGNLLGEILGLTQQQFLQVILLAQNRFAQFLLAKNDERQSLLRTLFGSRAYGDYQAALETRRKQSEQRLARGGDEVRLLLDEADLLVDEHVLGEQPTPVSDATDPAPGAFPDELPVSASATPRDSDTRIRELDRAVERARYRLDTLRRERDVADAAEATASAALVSQTALRATQLDRVAARAALAAREADEHVIADARIRIERALAAEALRPAIDASRRARTAADGALVAQRSAAEAWVGSGEGEVSDAAALRGRIESMTGDLGRWGAAVEKERELAELDAEVQAARDAESVLVGDIEVLDQRLGALPGRLAVLDESLAPLADAPVVLATASQANDELTRRLDAAKQAAGRAAAMVAADAHHLECSAKLDHAAAQVTALLRRRLAGYAGELAVQLVSGEPCDVCGSREHPAPAERAEDSVTETAIAEAEAIRDHAVSDEREAAVAAREARAAHAEAAGRAGGATVEALESAVRDASIEREAAAKAEHRRVELAADREQATADERELNVSRAEVAERRAELRNLLTLAEQRSSAARAAVLGSRGEFDSVAARVAATEGVRTLAQALADALEESARLALRAAEADLDRDERVAASAFDDMAAAVAALVEPGTRLELAARVHDHDVALRSERDRLRELELELAGQPEEPVDLAVPAAALAAARDVLRAATETATRAAATAERLDALAGRARDAHAASADLAAEHDVIAGLALALSGRTASRMDLETFVLAAELEEIIAAANLRLTDMSSGRYQLQHTDAVAARNAASGLGIEIIDAFTGRTRPAQSLSGGETFLASLALALGLAEVVTARAGGLRLDTLFIDEGFGSLDAETLELAMNTLDELRQGGRTVGVISHVEAMKEQLPAQLVVTASPQGSSSITQAAVPRAATTAV